MKVNAKGKGRDDYETPRHIFEQLNAIFNFTLDAACTTENQLAPLGCCFDAGEDGLKTSWASERVFCNPPFSKKAEWIAKAHAEVEGGVAQFA